MTHVRWRRAMDTTARADVLRREVVLRGGAKDRGTPNPATPGDYRASVKRLVRDGVDVPLARLFVDSARSSPSFDWQAKRTYSFIMSAPPKFAASGQSSARHHLAPSGAGAPMPARATRPRWHPKRAPTEAAVGPEPALRGRAVSAPFCIGGSRSPRRTPFAVPPHRPHRRARRVLLPHPPGRERSRRRLRGRRPGSPSW